jgi:alkaline phosphatase
VYHAKRYVAVTAKKRLKAPKNKVLSMGLLMNGSLGLIGGFFMVPDSAGSATKVADAAKSMNNSSTMICMGANGKGMPRMIGMRKMETKATLQAK